METYNLDQATRRLIDEIAEKLGLQTNEVIAAAIAIFAARLKMKQFTTGG